MQQTGIQAGLQNAVHSLWRYRGFVVGSVRREFQARYRNSMLGAAWMVLNPLAMIVVYTVIFSQLMHARLPNASSQFAYGIYLCAGLLTWGFFTEVVSRMQNVFLENGNLIKKLSFPRICLPIITVLNAGLNFAIIFGLFLCFLLLSGNFPGWVFLAIVPVLLIQILFSIGLGIILGVLNVFFRDIGQLFGIVLQFWFWFTPIVYTVSTLPGKIQTLLKLNPMASLIVAYQGIFVSGTWPDWSSLLPVTLISLALCWFGLQLFRRHAGEMVDEL
ncbi:ABC transporter permease [Collimonas arenae]|uniref:ABC transporter permease n=1 Tax=Collimonas arenae TaxID=279058 RepID=UPI00077869BE|nr:ABC transporter permease [Collimonas arenae]